jgi:hypothetical protein
MACADVAMAMAIATAINLIILIRSEKFTAIGRWSL